MARPLDVDLCLSIVASERWLTKVEVSDTGCWLFAVLDARGYGQITHGRRTLKAHRVALVAALGRDLLPAMTVSHDCHDADPDCRRPEACRHRACVNPDHLSEKTLRDNANGSPNAKVNRTHCPQGHPLVPGNLVASRERVGYRGCLICHTELGRVTSAAIGSAALALGMTRRDYISRYGQSLRTAREVIGGDL